MTPAPALLSDSLAAAQRRAVPALRAQEQLREADFARLLHERSGGVGVDDRTDALQERAEDLAIEGPDAGDQSAEEAADPDGVGSVEHGEEHAEERGIAGETEQGDRSQGGDGTGGVGENLAVEPPRSEQPVTIRSLNTQLLHDGPRLDFDPRVLLTKRVQNSAGLRVGDSASAELGDGGAARESLSLTEPTRTIVTSGETHSDAQAATRSEQTRAGGASDLQRAADPGSVSKRDVGNAPSRAASEVRESSGLEAARAAIQPTAAGANARIPDIAPALQRRAADHHRGGPEGASRPVVSTVGGAVGGAGGGQAQAGLSGSTGGKSAVVGGGGSRATTDEPNAAFKQQVLRGLSAAVAQAGKGGSNELVLRLQPGHLGQLKVRVTMDADGGGLAARFEVNSKEAQRLIDGSLGDLRASLESRGLGVGELEVRVAVRERPVSDPLGLITGTPYAERSSDQPGGALAADPREHTQGFTERDGEMTDHEPDGSANSGQHGPEARMERGPGSTDAPQSSLFLDDSAAERLLGPMDEAGAISLGRGEDGVLRLMVDAVA
jgi:hypothetical protein